MQQYDLFLIDEASQIDDPVAVRLRMALSELPHRHVLMVAADYHQLQPIEGGGHMLRWCIEMDPHYLMTVHRTNDPLLLTFLQTIRKDQPTRPFLKSFWRGYELPSDLEKAARCNQKLQKMKGQHFIWLCVTSKGPNEIKEVSIETRTDPPRHAQTRHVTS